MADNDILSQEEIDELLHGVASGEVEIEDEYRLRDGVPRVVDLTAHERIVRGRMPTLEMIGNRFCRHLRASMFGLIRRAVEVSFQGVKLCKFSEYVHTLHVPTSLNMVHMRPLRGTALFVIDARLVFSIVDNYFGGTGRFHPRIEGRDFTLMENRVIQLTLQRIFADLKEAWSPVMPVEFEYINSEINPQFANIVSPTEVVVVSAFKLDIDGAGGELHVTLPYSMIEPIREQLDAGVQSDRTGRDERWTASIREEMGFAKVEIHATLAETTMRLSELMRIEAGDIVPIELPPFVTLCAEGVPLFRCRVGVSNGINAVQIIEPVKREAWSESDPAAEPAAETAEAAVDKQAEKVGAPASARSAQPRQAAQRASGAAARPAQQVSTT
nr:flagellar motor switch protein FliM [Gammaproteobacteria bacterium]